MNPFHPFSPVLARPEISVNEVGSDNYFRFKGAGHRTLCPGLAEKTRVVYLLSH